MDGDRLYDYDQLMVLLPRASRPLRLLFEGAGAALAAPPEDESTIPVPSSQSPLVLYHPSSQKQRGKGTDRAPGGGSDSYSGSSSSSDSDSRSSRSSDSSGSSTSSYISSKRGSTSETDAPGGETTSAAAPALPVPDVSTAAAANGGRMADRKASGKEEQPRLNPPTGVVSEKSPAAVSRDINVSLNSGVLASPVPAAGSQNTAVSPSSIKTPRREGKSEDLDVVITNGECSSVVHGKKRVTVSGGRHRSESNGRTGGKEEEVDDSGPRREDAKRVVAGLGQGNGNPQVGAMEMGRVKEVVPQEASRREIVQAEEALETASVVAVSASRDKKKKAVKSGKKNDIGRDGDGHSGSRRGNGGIKGVSEVGERAIMSSSRRSLAEKDGSSKDDSSVFTQGAKVSWGMTSKERGGLEGIGAFFHVRPRPLITFNYSYFWEIGTRLLG